MQRTQNNNTTAMLLQNNANNYGKKQNNKHLTLPGTEKKTVILHPDLTYDEAFIRKK